eukprot:1157891-Pelagomonas_calceolata.AAC.12
MQHTHHTLTMRQRYSACSRVPIWCAKLSSCVMTMSWKFSWSFRENMMAFRASAKEDALSAFVAAKDKVANEGKLVKEE